MPEASLISFDETNLAPLVFKIRLPDQGTIAKYPYATFLLNDVLWFHCLSIMGEEDRVLHVRIVDQRFDRCE